MSGFAVTYQRQERPGGGSPLRPMLATLDHRGPDGVDSAETPPFALGHRHFWTTPEEVGERQPLVDEETGSWLVFDGRLDNRDELLATLGESSRVTRGSSDARIVLAAYRRWRRDCFRRFLGPFAAVVCEPGAGVVCARDPLGDRSLCYRLEDGRLLVASEEQAILAAPGVSAALDEDRLAHYFAVRVPDGGSTFFAAVRELPPGHLLIVGERRSKLERYHVFEPPAPIRCRDDREYGARYLDLLEQSVSCRLRSTTPVAVMMSGGLDSTPVAAVAAARDGCEVRPASWIFDELESCDERRYMDPLLERHRLSAIRFRGDGEWPLRRAEQYSANPNAPEENAYRGLKARLYRSVAASGSRCVLNGGSADLLYFGYQQWLADLLREGRVVEALVGLGLELGRRGPRRAVATVARKAGLRPAPSQSPFASASWLTPQAKRGLVADEPRSWEGFRRPSQCRNVFGARQAHSLAREVFHAASGGVDLRHPYRDRRLIDFMLAIPAHQLYRRGRFKPLVRQALRELLPDVILQRSDRTSLTPLFERGVRRREAARIEEILGRPGAVWPRYVRRDWLERARRSPPSPQVESVVLWQCVAFELWSRRWGRS